MQISLPCAQAGNEFSYISSTLTSIPPILQTVGIEIPQNHTFYIADFLPKNSLFPYHLLVILTWLNS